MRTGVLEPENLVSVPALLLTCRVTLDSHLLPLSLSCLICETGNNNTPPRLLVKGNQGHRLEKTLCTLWGSVEL